MSDIPRQINKEFCDGPSAMERIWSQRRSDGQPTQPPVFFRRTIVLFCGHALCVQRNRLWPEKNKSLKRVFATGWSGTSLTSSPKDERDAFLKLTHDEDREKFIETFWEIRNPSPGSLTNTYKDELYQRIAFADARFGIGSGVDGLAHRSGPYLHYPRPSATNTGLPQLRQSVFPWKYGFYRGANPRSAAVFLRHVYQREGSGDYRFYSPYTDGPDKLATGVEGHQLAFCRVAHDSRFRGAGGGANFAFASAG